MSGETTLREELAALAHDQWSQWMRYFFAKCDINEAADLIVPADYVAALQCLIDSPYADLPEEQKDNDRNEADRVLGLLEGLS